MANVPQNRFVPKSLTSSLGRRHYIQNRLSKAGKPTPPPPPAPPSAATKQMKRSERQTDTKTRSQVSRVSASTPIRKTEFLDHTHLELERDLMKVTNELNELKKSFTALNENVCHLSQSLLELITDFAVHKQQHEATHHHVAAEPLDPPIPPLDASLDTFLDTSLDTSLDASVDTSINDYTPVGTPVKEDWNRSGGEDLEIHDDPRDDDVEPKNDDQHEERTVVLPGGVIIKSVGDLDEYLLNTCRKTELVELCRLFHIDMPLNPRKATLWALVANHITDNSSQ